MLTFASVRRQGVGNKVNAILPNNMFFERFICPATMERHIMFNIGPGCGCTTEVQNHSAPNWKQVHVVDAEPMSNMRHIWGFLEI